MLLHSLLIIKIAIWLTFLMSNASTAAENVRVPPWLVRNPEYFQSHNNGVLADAKSRDLYMELFNNATKSSLSSTDGVTDGEAVDAMEHFFWGKMGGIAMELGALDGSTKTRSMTVEFENSLKWQRILVEGDPKYRSDLAQLSPNAFSANAAICSERRVVHFLPAEYLGGIAEFMSPSSLKSTYAELYDMGKPPGNMTSINWRMSPVFYITINCIPLSEILHKAHVHHINFFLLDVEVLLAYWRMLLSFYETNAVKIRLSLKF